MDILIIDDSRAMREAMVLAVESLGHEGEAVSEGRMGLRRLREERFDLVILDLRLGEEDGLGVLSAIRKQHPGQAVVMVTAEGTIAEAVEATRRGAIDFVEKPVQLERLGHVMGLVQKTRHLETRLAELETEVKAHVMEPQFASQDASVQGVLEVLFRAADSPASILILGQSGTGKSVAARAVHAASGLRDQPMVTVSCPSLSRELLESDLFGHVKGAFTGALRDHWGKVRAAEGGTLLLDEIGELPLELQPKLLRLLQEHEYERLGENKTRRAEVRIIAATNRDLEAEVAAGRFREDLFYRLNVITVTMPPLRERPGDLLAFAGKYLAFFAAQMKRRVVGFSAEAERCLLAHPWPGNLRELRNTVERAVILAAGPAILPGDLPVGIQGGGSAAAGLPVVGSMMRLEDLEREHIRRVVGATATMKEAARVLGIDVATLHRKRRLMEAEVAELRVAHSGG